MTRWQLVPVEPDFNMKVAFGYEIRRQAGKLSPNSTAHEPLEPLWRAVLDAAPTAPMPTVCGSAAEGWNAGLSAFCAVARASAARLQDRIIERPTRFSYAIEALAAIAEAGEAMMIPPPEPEPAADAEPKPLAPVQSGAVA